MKQRLQKLISAAGLCSRRQAEQWIAEGKVTVNGELAHLGDGADPEVDEILLDGRPLPAAPETRTTILLNKPRGYVTTLSDERGRPTVADLLPPDLPRLYPVGRLDQFSEGLLLLTDDGDLAHRLTHPRGEVNKTYRLWVSGWHEGALEALRRPITLDGRPIRKPAVRLVWANKAPGTGDQGTGTRHQAPGTREQATEKAFPLRGRCPGAHTGADEVVYRQASASDKPTEDRSATSSVTRLAGDGGCHLPLKGKAEATALLEITIHEGRNRQIRRMAEAAGLTTTRLQRIAEGPISLGDLKPGQWRYLTEAELERLTIDS